MASQSTLTITRPDPSATKVSNIYSDWTEGTPADGTVTFSSTGTTFSSLTDTEVDGTYYSKEFSLKGKALVGARFNIGDSGDSGITCCFQWFNPKGTSHDGTGDQAGGTWTDIGSAAQDYTINTVDATLSGEWDIIQKCSKVRVKVICASASDKISTINTAAFATIDIWMDKSDELNVAMASVGGIGADPS